MKDVAFAKRRSLEILDMVKSAWVYKRLKNFRAGIEANISTLVWSSIVAYNLQVIARIKLESVKAAA